MKKAFPDRYCYPAIFTYEEKQEIAVVFPDLELATNGIDDADALYSARDALGGRLELMEESGEDIPAPSRIADIEVSKNERVVLVDVYMPSVRMEGVTKSVKRTVTLPAWLNAKAMELGINFSQILQEALQKKISAA